MEKLLLLLISLKYQNRVYSKILKLEFYYKPEFLQNQAQTLAAFAVPSLALQLRTIPLCENRSVVLNAMITMSALKTFIEHYI